MQDRRDDNKLEEEEYKAWLGDLDRQQHELEQEEQPHRENEEPCWWEGSPEQALLELAQTLGYPRNKAIVSQHIGKNLITLAYAVHDLASVLTLPDHSHPADRHAWLQLLAEKSGWSQADVFTLFSAE